MSLCVMSVLYYFNKIFFGKRKCFKYFIGYKDNETVGPSCLGLLKISGYAKRFY